MTRDDIVSALLVLLLVLVASVPRGASGSEHVDQVLPLRIELIEFADHPQVEITISVPRQLVGKEIPDDHFVVVDGGAPVAPRVEKLSNDDLEVVLVLDTSGSMAGAPLEEAKSAAAAFTAQLPDGVRIAVIGFGSEPRAASPFTVDVGEADAAIEGLAAGGETALYDAILTAARLFEGDARRAVVVLSDGGDTVSAASLEEAIIDLLAAEADFYAVGLETSETDADALSRMAIASAGRAVAANDPAALAGIFDEIASGLVNRYRLAYATESYGRTEVVVAAVADGIRAQGSNRVSFPAPPAVPIGPEAPPPVPVALDPEPQLLPEPMANLGPGVLGNAVALYGGAAAIFLASAIILGLALASGRRIRIGDKALRAQPAAGGVAGRAIIFAEKALGRTEGGRGLGPFLERAGSRLRPGEFVLMAASAAVIGSTIGYFLGGWRAGAAGAALLLLLSPAPLQYRAQRRQRDFADQLGDNLQLIAGSVRSGYGLVQAIETVGHEALPPTNEEFRRLVAEINLGRDTGDALRAAADRTRNDDFKWVVEAMDVHRQVGGDLSELLDSVASTIRERTQLRRKVEALSAEGRLSAIILLTLPFALGGFIAVVNPGYLSELTQRGVGQFLLALGLVLMAVGVVWMRRVIRMDY